MAIPPLDGMLMNPHMSRRMIKRVEKELAVVIVNAYTRTTYARVHRLRLLWGAFASEKSLHYIAMRVSECFELARVNV